MAIQLSTQTTEGGGVKVISWANLLNGNSGEAVGFSSHPDKTVHVAGTFSTGGSVNLEGSNDGTNWVILTDSAGTAITLTAAGLVTVTQNPLFIRPNVTAGDGSTAIDVILVARNGA